MTDYTNGNLRKKIEALIYDAKRYPYDQTDMTTVIKNLEDLLK